MQSAKIHQQSMPLTGQQWALVSKIKIAAPCLFFVLPVTIAAAYLFTILYADEWLPMANYYFVLFFMCVGVSHIFIFPRRRPFLDGMAGFIYMLLLSLMISLALYIVFLATGFQVETWHFSAAAAFLLPYCILLCWHFYKAVFPVKLYTAWVLPAGMQPQIQKSLLLNSIPFYLKIKVKEMDAIEMVFTVTLTGRMQIGEMFCRFLYDQKGTIATSNEKGQPCGWFFYLKKWHGTKQLDPGMTLIENGIAVNDVLIVKRAVQ